MHKGFKYRIYPTKQQASKMRNMLEECRWLYNYLLEERKNGWVEAKKSFTLYDQIGGLPNLKKLHPSLDIVYAQVLQEVATRIDLAFKGFFRRVKAGEKPGYPRFKGRGRYNSFCYTQLGYGFDGNIIKLGKIGKIKIKLHRPLEGQVKNVCVGCDSTGKWYVTVSCKIEGVRLPESNQEVGIDVGLNSFATLSNKQKIENPRFFRQEEKALAKADRRLSRETKGTPQREKRRKVVARIHERIANKRRDFAHKQSHKIIEQFGFITVEDIHANRMMHNRCLSKSIMDASWGQFLRYLSYKAENAGRKFIAVNPAYTSQTCSACGHRQPIPLSERVFNCPCCGLSIDRDHNASLNILALGLQSIGNQSVEAPSLGCRE